MTDLATVLAHCETQIPWWQPQVGREERTLIGQVLDSQFLNDGAVTREFEQVLAERLDCRHVLTVTSGTAALFVALYGLGIGPGDEVIVPDITFVATANAVTLTGATPVLADVEPQRLTLAPQAVQEAITPQTKAIVPVHLSGRAANMEALLSIAAEHNLAVVEDAAEALFSRRQDRCLGTFGQAGCFSFSPMKMIQTGQGGAIATDDDALFERFKEIKDQGRRQAGTGGGGDVHHAVGFNFKLTNLHAAVGLVQLNRVRKRIDRVIRHYRLYQKHLVGLEQVQVIPFEINEGESPLWVDALVERREQLIAFLKEQRIDCRPYWQPLHCQAPYRQSKEQFIHSSDLAGRALWLPSAFTLLDDDIIRVCEEIHRFYQS